MGHLAAIWVCHLTWPLKSGILCGTSPTSPWICGKIQNDLALKKKHFFCGWLPYTTILALVLVQINFRKFLASKQRPGHTMDALFEGIGYAIIHSVNNIRLFVEFC